MRKIETPSDKTPADAAPGELELRRQLSDLAARVEMRLPTHGRQATMQRLLAKTLALSDREFETAVGALEGLLDRFASRKVGEGEGKDAKPADVVRDVERTLQDGLSRTPGR